MNKIQVLVISIAVFFCLLLYFGFDTKSNIQKENIVQRALEGTQIDMSAYIRTAKKGLAVSDLNKLETWESGLSVDLVMEEKVDLLKRLSGEWYRQSDHLIAGYYAKKVAELLGSDEAWSIAGTTYMSGLGEKEVIVDETCLLEAVACFENAISLAPQNLQHRLNLALIFVEKPDPQNPMRGIQMLLKLNEENPDYVPVLVNLGRLALTTNQLEKAKDRLEKAITLEPNNHKAVCLLGEVLSKMNDDRARQYQKQCELLTNKK